MSENKFLDQMLRLESSGILIAPINSDRGTDCLEED